MNCPSDLSLPGTAVALFLASFCVLRTRPGSCQTGSPISTAGQKCGSNSTCSLRPTDCCHLRNPGIVHASRGFSNSRFFISQNQSKTTSFLLNFYCTFPLPFIPIILPSTLQSPHCYPCPWAPSPFCSIPLPPHLPNTCHLLSIYESVSILLVSSVCSLESTWVRS